MQNEAIVESSCLGPSKAVARKVKKKSAASVSVESSGVSRRNAEDRLAKVFMGIIAIFLVLHFPRVALDFYELATMEKTRACEKAGKLNLNLWTTLAVITSQLLLVVNSSVNMVVYCCLGSKFRAEVFKTAKSIYSRVRKPFERVAA